MDWVLISPAWQDWVTIYLTLSNWVRPYLALNNLVTPCFLGVIFHGAQVYYFWHHIRRKIVCYFHVHSQKSEISFQKFTWPWRLRSNLRSSPDICHYVCIQSFFSTSIIFQVFQPYCTFAHLVYISIRKQINTLLLSHM